MEAQKAPNVFPSLMCALHAAICSNSVQSALITATTPSHRLPPALHYSAWHWAGGNRVLLGFGFVSREFRILIPCPPIPGHATGGSAFPLAHAWSGFLIDCLLVSLQHAQRGSMGQAATSIACARMGGHATPPRGTAPAQWDGLGWPVSWVRTRPTVSGHGLCHQPVPFWGGLPLG